MGEHRVNTLAVTKSSQHNDVECVRSATMGLEQDEKVKIHTRIFIKHNYHDHSGDTPETQNQDEYLRTQERFPMKLHKLLIMVESAGLTDIISWQVHGRAFQIHKTKEFMDNVMPLHFCHNHITSFYRQLNIYGFLKITQGPDKGAYYHEFFLREKYFLAKNMQRQKVKGTFVKGAADPANEPNFYKMPFVQVTLGYAEASALFQPHESLFAEGEVSAADAVSCLQLTKDEDFLLEDINWDSSSIGNEPFDNIIASNNVFCNDEVFFPLSQELEPSVDPEQTRCILIYGESIFEDISLEEDLSHSKQYYSLLEYVDMCALVQMIIDELE